MHYVASIRSSVLTLVFAALLPTTLPGQSGLPDDGGAAEQGPAPFPLALHRPAPDVVGDDWWLKDGKDPIGKVIRAGAGELGGSPEGGLPKDIEKRLAKGLKDIGRALRRSGKSPGALSAYHGDVVVVHVIDWSRPEAAEDQIELMKLVSKANLDRGIQVLGIMSAGEDAERRAKQAGIFWPVAMTSMENSSSQYVIMAQRAPVFVIGRSGELAWYGQASAGGAFLTNLGEALGRVGASRIEKDLVADLDDALREYYVGKISKAVSIAKKVQASGKRNDQRAMTRDATHLLNQVRMTEASWVQEMRKASGRRSDYDRYLRLVDALVEGFPRTAGKEAKLHEKELCKRGSTKMRLKGERLWLKCAEGRPALFPARRDKDGDRFAKKVEKFVSGTRGAAQATERGQDLLDRYRAAVE